MLDARYWIQDPGSRMQDAGYLILIEFLTPCALSLTPYAFNIDYRAPVLFVKLYMGKVAIRCGLMRDWRA